MKIEDKLKSLIIERYGNMVEFSKAIGMPNATLASILSRGVHKASIDNIVKICKALDISTDELAKDRIVPVAHSKQEDLRDIFRLLSMNLESFTLFDEPISKGDAEIISDALELTLEFIRRRK